MKLIDVKTIRTRLGLSDDEGVNLSIRSAIDATSPSIEATLGTSFTQGSKVDVFHLAETRPVLSCGQYRLRLSNGFVRPLPVIAISYASSISDLSTGTALTDSEYLLSDELGFVQVPDTLRGQYVRVAYDYGFSDLAEVPDWLKEAAISYVTKLLSMQQISSGKPDLSPIFKFISDHYETIMNSHLRVSALAIKPVLG